MVPPTSISLAVTDIFGHAYQVVAGLWRFYISDHVVQVIAGLWRALSNDVIAGSLCGLLLGIGIAAVAVGWTNRRQQMRLHKTHATMVATIQEELSKTLSMYSIQCSVNEVSITTC